MATLQNPRFAKIVHMKLLMGLLLTAKIQPTGPIGGAMGRILRFFTLGPLVAKVYIISTPFIQLKLGHAQGVLAQNFKSIGPAVSEERLFEIWEEEKK